MTSKTHIYTWVPDALEVTLIREAVHSRFVTFASGHLEGSACITRPGHEGGCSFPYSLEPASANQLPIAKFVTTGITPPPGAACSNWWLFDASSSRDVATALYPATATLSYKWEVNGVIVSAPPASRADDGGGGSGPTGSPTLVREFCNPGSYEIRLLVDDREGGIDATRQTIVISPPPTNQAPIARVAYEQTRLATATQCAQFSFNGTASSDPEHAPLSYSWSLDGGTAITGPDVLVLDVCGSGSHVIALTVNDGSLSNTASQPFNVPPPNQAPVARIVIAQTRAATATQCAQFSFSGKSSSDPENDPLSYSWSLDNGAAIAGPDELVLDICTSGTHVMALTVSDGALSNATSVQVDVAPPPPPPLSISMGGPDAVQKNTSCTWTAYVSGGRAPYTYYWFRNGVLEGSAATYTKISQTGFTLSLKVVDADGRMKVTARELDLTTTNVCNSRN
jgi:hypothetical protein